MVPNGTNSGGEHWVIRRWVSEVIGFTMDLACKDLNFALQLGRDFGVPLEVAGLVEQTFIRARAQYGGAAWSSQVVKLLEDALHSELRAPGFPAVLEE